MEMRVTELVERLDVKQSTGTHHLKSLVSAGLIRMKKEGIEHFYSLTMESGSFSDRGRLKGLK